MDSIPFLVVFKTNYSVMYHMCIPVCVHTEFQLQLLSSTEYWRGVRRSLGQSILSHCVSLLERS